jgi:hypothetical protein
MTRKLKIKGYKDMSSISYKDMSWRDNAACATVSTSIFFSTPKSPTVYQALSICKSCPVRKECFYEAILYGYDGVWGGSTPEQRTALISHILEGNLNNFDRQKSDYIFQYVDKIGITKNTALADLLNYKYNLSE